LLTKFKIDVSILHSRRSRNSKRLRIRIKIRWWFCRRFL